MNRSAKKGSALLIVLGFLSFMVVSAVSFAVYMRTERLSSSGYRYSVSSRHYCRAALAQALDHIETDLSGLAKGQTLESAQPRPFPGLNSDIDHWMFGRVFAPSIVPYFTNTVASLSLEGLGYLPPALINDVRYWSRFTSTAMWNRMDFDVARCAYTIVNVSDMLDVNKVRVTARSSQPENRLSLAYMWSDAYTESWKSGADGSIRDASKAENYSKKVLEERGGTEKDVPFVSLLDYNVVAAGSDDSESSPFFQYLKSSSGKSTSPRFFYGKGGDSEDQTVLEAARRGWIVTDSWSTNDWPSAVSENYANLAYSEGQPFSKGTFSGSGNDVSGLEDPLRSMNRNGPWRRAMEKGIGSTDIKLQMGMSAILYDYLDKDDVPVSLALPCTERAPMVAALEIVTDGNGFTVQTESKTSSGGADGEETVEYSLTLPKGPFTSLRGVAVIPFKNYDAFTTESWDVEGFARVWIEKKDTKSRLKTGKAIGDPQKHSSAGGVDPKFDAASWSYTLRADSIKLPQKWQRDKDCFQTFGCRPDNLDLKPVPFARRETKVETEVQNGKQVKKKTTKWKCLLVDASGAEILTGEYDSRSALESALKEYSFRCAVWVAVKSADGKMYADVVPACLEDDTAYNKRESTERDIAPMGTIHGFPMLYFPQSGDLPVTALLGGGTDDDPSGGASGTGTVVSYDWKCLETVDPRYNYAPENWFVFEGSADSWINNGRPARWETYFTKRECDPDMYMAVSDCTNLQSIAELAMLPRYADVETTDRYDGRALSSTGTPADERSVWRTFRLFSQDGIQDDGLYSMGVVNMKPNFQRLNPYSNILPIQMALVADTPYDWWSAGLGYSDGGTKSISLKDARAYTFAPEKGDGDEAVISLADQTNIAARIFAMMRFDARHNVHNISSGGKSYPDWTASFRELDWFSNGDERSFLGVPLISAETRDLHLCDKKFLYGFWRECLGLDQQLFLVFVRCEPIMLGGNEPGSTPAQLGARAVALVWRNPLPPLKSDAPHRTRILFYRQFE